MFLAIDQGGHSSRALIYDDRARLVSQGRREIRAERPASDRYEYDSERLRASIVEAMIEAVDRLGPRRRDVTAAGLATQRSNIVCWDRDSGAALSPVIAWQDHRARDQVRTLRSSAPRIREITGLPVSAHYGASKLRWCLDHLSEVKAAQRDGRLAWGPMSSFLLFHLLKERPLWADPANAARTLLYDIDQCDWSPEMLALFGLPPEPLPRCVPTRHEYGILDLGGLNIPLVVATGDQAAALYAFGRPAHSTLHVTVGTGAFIQRAAGTRRCRSLRLLDSIVYCGGGHCRYAVEGTVNGAGGALDWLAGARGGEALAARLGEWLGQIDHPPLFLNGVAGLGTPYLKPEFNSRFIGGAGIAEQAVAVVESIIFLLQVNMEELARLDLSASNLRIGGGLARLNAFCQRLADLSGLSVQRPEGMETTGRGLAYLVCAAAADKTKADAYWQDTPGMETFAPRVDKALESRYHHWRATLEEAVAEGGNA